MKFYRSCPFCCCESQIFVQPAAQQEAIASLSADSSCSRAQSDLKPVILLDLLQLLETEIKTEQFSHIFCFFFVF